MPNYYVLAYRAGTARWRIASVNKDQDTLRVKISKLQKKIVISHWVIMEVVGTQQTVIEAWGDHCCAPTLVMDETTLLNEENHGP